MILSFQDTGYESSIALLQYESKPYNSFNYNSTTDTRTRQKKFTYNLKKKKTYFALQWKFYLQAYKHMEIGTCSLNGREEMMPKLTDYSKGLDGCVLTEIKYRFFKG